MKIGIKMIDNLTDLAHFVNFLVELG